MNRLTTSTAKSALYDGRAIRSSDASPAAQSWLRSQAKAGRVVKLTHVEGWCPAHRNWTFYVSHNHAPAFLEKCRDDHNQTLGWAILDEYVRGDHASAHRLQEMIR